MIQKSIPIVLLAGMIFGLAPINQAGEGKEEKVAAWQLETQGWSRDDYMAAAKEQEQALQSLESQVLDVEKRIANLEKKPYFDTKGLKEPCNAKQP